MNSSGSPEQNCSVHMNVLSDMGHRCNAIPLGINVPVDLLRVLEMILEFSDILLKPRWHQLKFSHTSNILISSPADCKAEPANDAKPSRNGHLFREVGMQGTQMSLSGFSSAWWRGCPQTHASAERKLNTTKT